MQHELELNLLREIKAQLDCSSDEYLREMRRKEAKRPINKVPVSPTGLVNSTFRPDVKLVAKEIGVDPNLPSDAQLAVAGNTEIKVTEVSVVSMQKKILPDMNDVIYDIASSNDYEEPIEVEFVFPEEDPMYINLGHPRIPVPDYKEEEASM